jgi:hypothetical protein
MDVLATVLVVAAPVAAVLTWFPRYRRRKRGQAAEEREEIAYWRSIRERP